MTLQALIPPSQPSWSALRCRHSFEPPGLCYKAMQCPMVLRCNQSAHDMLPLGSKCTTLNLLHMQQYTHCEQTACSQ